MFIRFDVIHERDRRTDGHCMTAMTALASHPGVKIGKKYDLCKLCFANRIVNIWNYCLVMWFLLKL